MPERNCLIGGLARYAFILRRVNYSDDPSLGILPVFISDAHEVHVEPGRDLFVPGENAGIESCHENSSA